MNKYDEIMREINLTPEARDRIINNVADSLSSDERKIVNGMRRAGGKSNNINKSVFIRKYLTTAACMILVVSAAIGAAKTDLFGLLDMGGTSSDSALEAGDEYETDLHASKEQPSGSDRNSSIQNDGVISGEATNEEEYDAGDTDNGNIGYNDEDGYGGDGIETITFESLNKLEKFTGISLHVPEDLIPGLKAKSVEKRFFAETKNDEVICAGVEYYEMTDDVFEVIFEYRKYASQDMAAEYGAESGSDFTKSRKFEIDSKTGRIGTAYGNTDGKYYQAYWQDEDYWYTAEISGDGATVSMWKKIIKELF